MFLVAARFGSFDWHQQPEGVMISRWSRSDSLGLLALFNRPTNLLGSLGEIGQMGVNQANERIRREERSISR